MNASFFEIVQTLSSIVGAILTSRAMVNADLNLIAVKRNNYNGNRKIIAEKNVRVERIILTIQIVFFLSGLIAMFQPAIPSEFARTAAVARMTITIASLVLMYLSYRNWLEERIPILLARRKDLKSNGSRANILAAVADETAEQARHTADTAHITAEIAHDIAQEIIPSEEKK